VDHQQDNGQTHHQDKVIGEMRRPHPLPFQKDLNNESQGYNLESHEKAFGITPWVPGLLIILITHH
jgi:hypothetical protein